MSRALTLFCFRRTMSVSLSMSVMLKSTKIASLSTKEDRVAALLSPNQSYKRFNATMIGESLGTEKSCFAVGVVFQGNQYAGEHFFSIRSRPANASIRHVIACIILCSEQIERRTKYAHCSVTAINFKLRGYFSSVKFTSVAFDLCCPSVQTRLEFHHTLYIAFCAV